MEKLNQNEVAVRSNNESNAERTLERYYIQNHFRDYVLSNMYYVENGQQYRNYKAEIMSKVFELVKGIFTLPQLHCLFMATDECGYSYEELNELKTSILNYIEEVAEEVSDLGDIASFRTHIMNMHPIILEAFIFAIYDSNLFFDEESEEFIYPDVEYIEEQLNKSL